MKRLAIACLSSCVTTAIVACAGTSTVASPPNSSPPNSSPPNSTAKATTTRNPGAAGRSSPTTTPSENNVAAVARSYYLAVAAQNYRLAFIYLAANATGPDGHLLTFGAFLRLAHTMENLAGPVTSFSVGAYKSLIVMTIVRKKIGPYHAHLQMALRGGIWRIIAIDRV